MALKSALLNREISLFELLFHISLPREIKKGKLPFDNCRKIAEKLPILRIVVRKRISYLLFMVELTKNVIENMVHHQDLHMGCADLQGFTEICQNLLKIS